MSNNVKNIGRRLQIFIDYLGVSNNKFGEELGVSGSVVSHMVNGNNFGVDKLIKILNTYPELDFEWLIIGKGVMLKEDKKKSTSKSREDELIELEIKHLKEQLKGKENELKAQMSLTAALQEIINLMKK